MRVDGVDTKRRGLRDRSAAYRGAGEGYTRAFELALAPAFFGAGGWLLDRWVGTLPIFTVLLAVAALAGCVLRLWYGYDAEMRAHDQAAPWGSP